MNILFLSRWFPYPPNNGAKIRIWNLLQSLSEQHQIHLVSFISGDAARTTDPELRKICHFIDIVQYKGAAHNHILLFTRFFKNTPRYLLETHNPEMQSVILNAVKMHHTDLVIASQVDMAYYAAEIKGIPKIFEELESSVYFDQYHQADNIILKARYFLTWWKYSRFIHQLLHEFEGCTVASDLEKQLAIKISPFYKNFEIVPNAIDRAQYHGYFGEPKPNTLIYCGALTYKANFDAVWYFLKDVFPLIQAKIPDVSFAITGDYKGVPTEKLPKHQNVQFTGYLQDVRPAIRQSWISVVPLRIGGGTRLKILESLALGTPVISTSKGAEGLELQPGRDIIIADTPAVMAAQVIGLLKDQALRNLLSENGKKIIAEKYNWDVNKKSYDNFLNRCLSNK